MSGRPVAGPEPAAPRPSRAQGWGGGRTCAIEARGVTSLLAGSGHRVVSFIGWVLLGLRRQGCQPGLMFRGGAGEGGEGVPKFMRGSQVSHKEVVNGDHL